ncbi:YceI family protein [Pectobacterium brasiliense]|uniref:YceI family protein n=1 Tax=Pectobacterium brasiliense TaxID=180957 RepID=UPI001CE14438|nr:YceI family protein [Pectobacterium brasiliense]MCA5920074.1 YceI family protein [Pectobacterium brasiliense]MCA5926965.1 YceI family protein [Pectobacterium brasiliense]MCA5936096.1 YceI family protein [Pectobacterium brasiliense]MCA5940004.1 YceI family protein [Pectobacterium brasiliense]MCA5944144.1 YceI family protein [Pectobacterium brasiliense]
MTRIVPVLAAGLLISPLLHAMPLNYTIVTDKTAIALSWQAFGHLSQASLDGVTGNITLDAEKEINDRIDVKIPITTLQASNRLLTYQLKSSLFFDAEHYPDITFTSSRVVALGHGHFRVFGSLSVKNIQRPVILDATLEEHGGNASGEEALSLHATTAISRSAFNMDRFTGVVDDRVAISIDIQTKARHSA